MRRTVFWSMMAVLASTWIAGCTGTDSVGGGGTPNESSIRGRYGQLERAVERESIGDAMLLFSTQYLDQGYNYVDVRNGFAELFDIYDAIQDTYRITSIDVNGNYALVRGYETLSGVNTFKAGRPREVSTTEIYDIWRYMDGAWYLYGDQLNGSGAAAGKARKPLRYSPERMKDAVPASQAPSQ